MASLDCWTCGIGKAPEEKLVLRIRTGNSLFYMVLGSRVANWDYYITYLLYPRTGILQQRLFDDYTTITNLRVMRCRLR